jgi:hypothetical protein
MTRISAFSFGFSALTGFRIFDQISQGLLVLQKDIGYARFFQLDLKEVD